MLGPVLECLNNVHTGHADPFEEYLGHQDLTSVEIWKYPDSEPASFKHEPVRGGDVASWLTSKNPQRLGRDPFAGLRLLIVPVIRNQEDAPSRPIVEQMRESIRLVYNTWALPSASLALFLNDSTQFAKYPSGTSLQSEHCHKYHLSMRHYALTWSFDTRTQITQALLFWIEDGPFSFLPSSDDSFPSQVREKVAKESVYDQPSRGPLKQDRQVTLHGRIVANLNLLRDFVDMPIFFGTVGAMLALTNVSLSLSAQEDKSRRIELRTRDLLADRSTERVTASEEYGQLSARVSWLNARVARHQKRLEVVRTLISHMMGENATFRAGLTSQNPNLRSQKSEILAECLDHLQQTTDGLAVQAAKLVEQSSVNLSSLYNIIAQRDQKISIDIADASRALALESKRDQKISIEISKASSIIALESRRDSSAMKTLAAVTMVFLPGTFVASIFAMPFFDFGNSDGLRMVNPRFWIYWVVTVPLTFFTFAIWLAWFQIKTKRESRENIDAADQAGGKDGGCSSASERWSLA
jgi:hypothetical protein